jgi:hypothetical protein
MWQTLITDEVRQAREDFARECNYNVQDIINAIMAKQQQHENILVHVQPNNPDQASHNNTSQQNS